MMKKMRILWVSLLIAIWIYPIQAQVPITQEMIRNPVQAVIYDLGSVKIYGKKAGKSTGFTFVNIYDDPVVINFNAYLTGNGTACFQEKRDLQIGEILYELDTTIFHITVDGIEDTIDFLFADGCASGYVGGQGWDNIVNVALDNFAVTAVDDTLEWLSIEELSHWVVEVYRLSNNLNMEGVDTLMVDSTEAVILELGFVQPLIRTPYQDQLDPITFARGDSLLDWFFTIDPDSGVWVGDSAFVDITQEFKVELGNWAWTGRPIDVNGLTAKQCNWQPFRIEQSITEPPKQNPPSILIQVQTRIRKN